MEPLAPARERRPLDPPARLWASVAEAPALPVSAAARAIQRAAQRGGEAPRVPASPSVVWIPRGDADGWSFAGWGAAARADGEGEERFAEVQARAERVFARVERAGALPIAPRLFGGFAFDASRARAGGARGSGEVGSSGARGDTGAGAAGARGNTDAGSPGARGDGELGRAWAAFGDAAFVLPRLLYGCSGDRAFVAAFAPEPDAAAALAGAARAALDALDGRDGADSRQIVFDSVEAAFSLGSAAPPGGAPVFEEGGQRAWAELVTSALSEIGREALLKVVLCRTRRVAFAREPDLLRAVALLEARHPACARFLFEQGGAAFLGASPERLVQVRGRRAVTEALAGSLPRRAAEDERAARERLLASGKDLAEHAFVVDAIRAALAPACEALSIAGAPQVRTLPHVHHLATPIEGALRERAHVLDLAARLHPTPALCGTPRAEARAFLLAREPDPRGWYGGGAGWIDAAGDGEIAVAIRSALAARRSAWIYAGAGIVTGSDPEKEYVETTAKERAMREALEAAA